MRSGPIGGADIITFAPPFHAQRLAFAGALFNSNGSIDRKMLTGTTANHRIDVDEGEGRATP